MNCFTVQISEPSGNILEIESCVNQVSNSVTIEQTSPSNELVLSQCMAQLPSDINDIIIGQIDSHLVAGSGISLISSSGSLVVATTGLQPSGNYASGVHYHVSSDVTDFNSSVSGLLPITDMLGGANISITNSGTVYTVAVSGQLGLTAEQVDDRVSSLLSPGSGITINYDDDNNLLYISTSGLQPSGNYITIDHTHTSSNITDFDSSVSGLLPSISGSGYITTLFENNIYTINVTGLQPSGNYSVVGHYHVISDVSGLQTALNDKQPSGNYAPLIHTHSSSDITNFDSSVSGLLMPYALLDSPNFSGVPTVPTASSGTNSNQIASTAFVRAEISNLIDSAPSTLDTLNELASALGDDPNFATTVTDLIASKVSKSGDTMTGTLYAPTGVFSSGLTLNGVPVSVSGHTHLSSDITDFGSSMSGLLPTIANSGDNRILTSTGSTVGVNAESNLTFDGSLLSISGNIIARSGTLDVLAFNTNIEPDLLKGQISWNDTEGTVDVGLTDDVTINIGEHNVYRVRNETGSVLYKGQVVYASGVHSNGIIEPNLYVADGSIREIRFIGLILENINDNNNGYAINFGHIFNIDTRGNVASPFAVGDETWITGDILYVHPTVPGKLTNIEPKHSIITAIILDAASNGKIFVRPTSYGHLNDNHDVNVSGVTDGQYLQYNAATDYWIATSSGTFSIVNVDNLRLDGNTLSATNNNGGIIVQTNGTGALQRDSGGNARGQYAVDLQKVRSTGTMVAGGNYSVIGGGNNNTATGSNSVVVGGNGNSATGNEGFVGGGSSNSATGNGSFVGAGFNNKATGFFFSTIAGGTNNQAAGFWSSVLGGQDNLANGTATTIGGGRFNTVAGGYSVVCGGISNKADGTYGGILGGQSNNDNGFSKVFIIGSNITATQANTTFVNNLDVASSGDIDTLKINKLYHQNLAVATGVANSDLMVVIVDPTGSPSTQVIQGDVLRSSLLQQSAKLQFRQGTDAERLLITPASGEPIWTTDTQKFYIGDGSTAGGDFVGPSPYDRGSGTESIVALNTSCVASGNYSAVIGGRDNTASGPNSIVGGGASNIASSINSTVGGGNTNTASGANSTVCGGRNNTASGNSSTIGGGGGTSGGNTANGFASTIAGGQFNTSSGYYSVVSGGQGNASSGRYSTVVGGLLGKASRYGENSHAAGNFGNAGDAQHTVLIARRLTTNNTADQVLFLDEATERLTLPAETTWTFEVKLSAYNDTDNAAAGWIYRGVIRRDAANSTVLVGSLIEESWKETAMNSATASVVADDTNEALEIRVTGLTGKNIRWVAVVDISQVSYGTP